ncbi:MAG: sigma-70 family RNA polymerase sigma factor [Clostridia bacterium]|nr:sigma-70 family RNA polymerase sigma factor [Clostridia bacterium]
MDRDEFTRRVRASQEKLYRISCGLLREPQDRMDAVQDAILKAWCNLRKLRDEEYFDTWLIRILINECHNRHRTQARFVPLESAPEPSENLQGNQSLRDAVYALPPKLRIPILLHYMEGYRTDEIAQMLRLPGGTVRSRLRRARTMLKTMLESTEGDG